MSRCWISYRINYLGTRYVLKIHKSEISIYEPNGKLIEFLFLGGVLLPVNRRQRAFGNGTLIIDQVQRSADAGTYTCQAQNRQKQSARKEVEVQVLGEKFISILFEREKLANYFTDN